MTTVPEAIDVSLYQMVLRPRWDQLAPAVRIAHGAEESFVSGGTFDITGASGRIARWIARHVALPPAGCGVPTRLQVRRGERSERWERLFGDFPLNSILQLRGRDVLVERFGRVEFHFRLGVIDGGIQYRQCGAAVLVGRWWMSLPRWLSPRIVAEEMPGDALGQTQVRVTIGIPIFGTLLEYRGRMQSLESAT
jgi:Domain of unknown function (DUF4166)